MNVRTDTTIAAQAAAYAAGDPIVDDYALLRAAADYAGAHPGATLIYPAGTYAVNRHSTAAARIPEISFHYLSGVQLIGCGATISVDGAFNRSSPDDHSVIPFDVWESNNFTIRGFTLEGNVAQMTHSAGINEGMSHGIETSSCHDYTIADMTVHGFATDGIILGSGNHLDNISTPPWVVDRNAYIRNVTSIGNARDALSLIQINGAIIENSVLSNSGITGNYGGHAPMAGVDIEPDYPPSAVIDHLKTGNIFFDNVQFTGNLGSQFIAAYPDDLSDVTVTNSTISAGTSPGLFQVVMTVSDGLIENTTIDTGAGAGYVDATYCGAWATDTTPHTTIRNTQITSAGYGVLAYYCTGVTHDVEVTIDGCTFNGRQSMPEIYMPNIRSPHTDFINNTVFIPKTSYSAWAGGYHVASLLQDVRLSAHNTFDTDLRVGEPAGQNGDIAPAGAQFWVSYNSGLVSQDAYNSSAPIYPYGAGSWVTGTPYNHYSQ